MVYYLIILLIVLTIMEWGYIKLARKRGFALTKHLSARRNKSVTGGGFIFYPAIAVSIVMGGLNLEGICLLATLGLLWIMSYIDDLHNLPVFPRLTAQFIFALTVITPYVASGDLIWIAILLLSAIFIVAVTNTFNFMDGIGGMLTVYGIVVVSTLLYVVVTLHYTHFIYPLAGLLVAMVVFGAFNFLLTDEVFSGDVGSIVSGFYIGSVMVVLAIFNTANLAIISVYLVDAGVTLVKRIVHRDNVLRSHKQHLYQLLVNERGFKHHTVALIYGGVQLAINVVLLALPDGMQKWFAVATYLALIAAYIVINKKIRDARD